MRRVSTEQWPAQRRAASLARSQFFMVHPPFSHDRRRSGAHVARECSLAGATVLHLRSTLVSRLAKARLEGLLRAKTCEQLQQRVRREPVVVSSRGFT